MEPIGKGRLALIAAVVIVALLAITLALRGCNEEEAPAPAPTPTATHSTPKQSAEPSPDSTFAAPGSLAEEATGEKYTGTAYGLNDAELVDMAQRAASYDTFQQTREQWEKQMDKVMVYTPQDLPREAVMNFAPPASDWHGIRLIADGEVLSKSRSNGQGGQDMYTWIVNAQEYREVNGSLERYGAIQLEVVTQCVTMNPDTCRILYLSGTPNLTVS